MAASLVAGPADCAPLPSSPHNSDPSLSPLPPNPPPPSTRGRNPPAMQILPHLEPPMRKSGGGHEQNSLANPTNQSSDFLPPEMLLTLKQQHSRKITFDPEVTDCGGNTLTPKGAQQSPKKDAKELPSVRPPANLWSYPRRRSRFTHLTAHPPCVCGAGRDISFLYDVPEDHKAAEQGEVLRSLIPEEYHIHKRAGVLGLEFHQDEYTTQSHAHDTHVTIFPSMKPGGRYEVIALKNTMDQMLEKAGVPQDDPSPNGPTQIHNLLELVRREQAIYNICFHEIIRQVSVHCVERGQLLQDIRRRYSQLLDRIPRQVMSLHNDVVAQRALHRRFTAEVKRFKSKMASIIDRLGELKDQDTVVVEESQQAHRELSSALAESEKNANVLREYHGVYELQRNRLQESVDKLRWERDVWQGAAYGLAGQVSEARQLSTLRRLQLGEKVWVMLAHHFTTLLSSRDTQQLGEVDECVRKWREGVMREIGRLEEREKSMRNRLSAVEDGMRSWCEELRSIIAADGRVIPLSHKGMQRLWEGLRAWLGLLNSESETFSGEALLTRMESLQALSELVRRWTQVALEVFSRHQEMNKFDHAPYDHTHSPEHQKMLSLNSDIDSAMKNCTTRISGDNGVAVGLIRLITPLETWDAKLNLCLTSNKKLPDSEWIKFHSLLQEWLDQVQAIRGSIGTVTSDTAHPVQCSQVGELVVEAEKWRYALSHSVTTRDTKIGSMVTDVHSDLILWMVQLLLTSTHTPPPQSVCRGGGGGGGGGEGGGGEGGGGEENGGSGDQKSGEEGEREGEEEEEEEEEEGSWERGMGLSAVIPVDLKTELESLSETLKRFTTSLTRCVDGVVERETDRRRKEGDPNSEEERRKLDQFGKEAGQWVEQAALLLREVVVGGRRVGEEGVGREMRRGPGQAEVELPAVGEDTDSDLPQEVFIIREDLNIHHKPLQQVVDETPQPVPPTLSELGLCTEQELPEGRGYLQRDTETLVLRLDHTQSKLEEQERVTQREHERAEAAEEELKTSRALVSSLEAELQQLRASLEQSSREAAARTTTRGGKGGGGKRGKGAGRPSSRK